MNGRSPSCPEQGDLRDGLQDDGPWRGGGGDGDGGGGRLDVPEEGEGSSRQTYPYPS